MYARIPGTVKKIAPVGGETAFGVGQWHATLSQTC